MEGLPHLPAVRDDLPILLEIDLSRGLADAPPSDPVAALRRRHLPLIGDVVAGLRRARNDTHVAGAVLLVGPGPSSAAQADELGAALEGFGRTGKVTAAIAESFGELSPGTLAYHLAAHCAEVWLQPSGVVSLTGVAVEVTLLRAALDKVGARPMIGQRHEYKSAADTFTRSEASGPQREMMQRLTDSALEQVVATVARRRRMTEQQVTEAMAAAPLPAAEALERRLVDSVGYRDEAYASLRERVGRGGELRLLYAHRYARKQASRPLEQARARRRPVVAVVPVRGAIATGRNRPGGLLGPVAGADTIAAWLGALHDDDAVKAVVLHVDSPGGSYVASDAIRRAVLALRGTGRPVVAAMGALAASGGYFVSMAADRIVALPHTLTGSIGVLGGKIVVHDTLARVGVTRETFGAGPQATMFAANLPYDDEQWQRLQDWLDAVYADFTQKAAADRGMPVEQLEPLARGRVWTGADARERRLVDELGALEDAVEVACARVGLRREQVRLRRPRAGLKERVRGPESTESAAAARAVVGVPPGGGLLRLVTAALGAAPTDGLLSLPWQLRLH